MATAFASFSRNHFSLNFGFLEHFIASLLNSSLWDSCNKAESRIIAISETCKISCCLFSSLNKPCKYWSPLGSIYSIPELAISLPPAELHLSVLMKPCKHWQLHGLFPTCWGPFLLARAFNTAEPLPGGSTGLLPWPIFFHCNDWRSPFSIQYSWGVWCSYWDSSRNREGGYSFWKM